MNWTRVILVIVLPCHFKNALPKNVITNSTSFLFLIRIQICSRISEFHNETMKYTRKSMKIENGFQGNRVSTSALKRECAVLISTDIDLPIDLMSPSGSLLQSIAFRKEKAQNPKQSRGILKNDDTKRGNVLVSTFF